MKCWVIKKDGQYYNNGKFGQVPFIFSEEPKAFNDAVVVECILTIPKTWQVMDRTTFFNKYTLEDIINGVETSKMRFNNGEWEEFKLKVML